MNPAIRDALDTASRSSCLLCDRAPAGGAVLFEPADPWSFFRSLPPEGKSRCLIYPACPDCTRSEGAAERAEAILRRVGPRWDVA